MDRAEYRDVCGETARGEGRGEWPLSETSVLSESSSGGAVLFQLKNCVIMAPGVLGRFGSVALTEARPSLIFTLRGGGREAGSVASVLVSLMVSSNSLTICFCGKGSLGII